MPYDSNDMYNFLASQYMDQDPQAGLADQILKRKRRMAMLQAPMMNFGQFVAPQQQQDPGMASDIFSAIGGGIGPAGGILGGIIPNVLSAIFKKRS